MGARERTTFELTLKGAEELSLRTYRLDAKIRNILFLIQRGYQTVEGILDNSIFPREEVVERLRDLLRGHFVTMLAPDNSSGSPTTIGRRAESNTIGPTPAPVPQAAATNAPEPELQDDPPVYFGL